ncbi:MAG: methylated-DNA--[protein]-cysteine S-methyltransferase [Planctomycetota bacterium]
MPDCFYTYYDSPVGRFYLESEGGELTHLLFADHASALPQTRASENSGPFRETIGQLSAYFIGKLKSFDLPLRPAGTEFQLNAWKALLEIPYGETRTYAEQARLMKNPKACRAVGSANGKNPISIIVPCHRVIGSSGKLTGYGGGLETKKFLLDLEARNR